MPAAVPIDPGKLIEAARDFANHQGGAGRPRPVWLRRAVSAAYYALFHSIAMQATEHLLPNCRREDRLLLARSFGHGPIREVCGWIAGRSGAPVHARQLVQALQNTPIDDVANSFVDLQEQRHAADYDHLTPFSKAATLAAIQDAEGAMRKLEGAAEAEREAFFALLALKTSLR